MPPDRRPRGDRHRPPAKVNPADLLHGQWGDLPEKEQQFLLNPSSDQLPVRYRRYIEEYFQKVQRAQTPR